MIKIKIIDNDNNMIVVSMLIQLIIYNSCYHTHYLNI